VTAKTSRMQTSLVLLAIALSCMHPAARADNEKSALYAGDWTGSYRPDGGEWEKAKFIVEESSSEAAENPVLSLTIQLGYLPREDWRFEAKKLEIDTDWIKFQFGKDSFQLECKLEKNNESELVGNCRPIDENAGSTASQMIMVPPRREQNAAGE